MRLKYCTVVPHICRKLVLGDFKDTKLHGGSSLLYKMAENQEFSGCPVVKTELPLQGALFRSLAGELRSFILCGVAKKTINMAVNMAEYNKYSLLSVSTDAKPTDGKPADMEGRL